MRSLRRNSRRLVHANISSLTRGDAFEYYLPKVKKLKGATIVNGIVQPDDGTDPFVLNSILPESQVKEWKEQMLQRNNSQTCYAETPSGRFSVRCVQKMLKIHQIKNIKAAVEREIVWFSEDYKKTQTVSENHPATAIMSFQKMRYSSKYDEAIRPHGITPTELSMIWDRHLLHILERCSKYRPDGIS